MIFILAKTGSRKRDCLTSNGLEKLLPGYKTYIELHISSVTLCNLFKFNPLIPSDWHQEKP